MSDVVVQPDGKIVLVGTSSDWISFDFAVTRLLPDGTPDPTFGSGGHVAIDFSGLDDIATSVVLTPDGTIIVGGAVDCDPYTWGGCRFGLAWYSPNGASYVTSFDNLGGVASLTLLNDDIVAASGPYLVRYGSFHWTVTTDFLSITNVVVQPDDTSEGKLVAAGWCLSDGTYFGCMARFGADGSLDTTFGAGGWVTDAQTIFRALTIQPDGKLVVGGGRSGDFALARYTSDGTLDGAFGTDGQVLTDFGNADDAFAITLQADGRIIAAGIARTPPRSGRFALARYDTDGSLDSTFGSLGKVTTDFGNPDFEWMVLAVTVQPDGKIIAAGRGQTQSVVCFLCWGAVTRYLSGPDQPAASDLVISALGAPAKTCVGSSLTIKPRTANQGTGPSGATVTRVFLSSNDTLDGSDLQLGSDLAVPGLAPGTFTQGSQVVTIPATTLGQKFLVGAADAGGTESETNESNNTFSKKIMIGPDLTIANITAPATSTAGATISVTVVTKNVGGCTTPATTTSLYFSNDNSVDAGDPFQNLAVAELMPNEG